MLKTLAIAQSRMGPSEQLQRFPMRLRKNKQPGSMHCLNSAED